MNGSAAQVRGGDHLARDRFDHGRAGDIHLRILLRHKDIVRDGRRVAGAAGAGPEDHADLRDHARAERVHPEDLRVAGQGIDALLDAGAAAVVDRDEGHLHIQRLLHGAADLLRLRFAQRSAAHRKVLRGREGGPSVDAAVAGHHTVAGLLLFVHAKIHGPGEDHLVRLHESPVVEQRLHALPRGQLSGAVLPGDAVLTARFGDLLTPSFEAVHLFLPLLFHTLICSPCNVH